MTLLGTLLFSLFTLRYFARHAPAPPPAQAPTVVTVEGDVLRPGVYLLEASESTVRNAVQLAGGIRRGAATIPLEALGAVAGEHIQSGQGIRVFSSAANGVRVVFEPPDAAQRLFLGEKLDLNRATVQELLLVPRMTRDMAEAIVSRRSQRPWESLDDLREIPGIGARTVERWKAYLAVSGPVHSNDVDEQSSSYSHGDHRVSSIFGSRSLKDNPSGNH